ncbi:type VII secretion protein EccB [Rhodococcus qingshengii]|uniref:type VII secretion protein EccB n=1 Tax=Rhodococcus qingshengii TaxID=334542 RepID=UPI001F14783C|nr:type VII secretion protein EccB [Rhodococcus qingshengii]ULD38990.1 type VII secretion protein EccB [Rhodococcus qingshengii]
MAPRFLTTKTQISGYRMLVRRIEQAFIRWDTRLLSSPFSAQTTAMSIGAGLCALILIAGLVVSWIKPAPSRGEATIIATQSGGRYVMFEGALHPVTNLSSARLITGRADSVKTVKDAELEKYPRGLLMGIPGAPDEMVPRTDDTSRWAVCTQYDSASALDLTPRVSTRTLIVAGDKEFEPNAAPIGENEAIVVSDSDGSTKRTWLLHDGVRSEISASDKSLTAALQINKDTLDQATPASKAFLDAIPVRETMHEPRLLRQGQTSTAVPQYQVGAVLSSAGVDGPSKHLVLDTGLQPIGDFAAQVLINSGSKLVDNVSAAQIAAAPSVNGADMDYWPATRPTLVKKDTVCFDWARHGQAAAETSLYALNSVPLSADARDRVVTLLPSRDQTPQADFFYTNPGRGWLAQVTGQSDDSLAREQLWWIGDNGVRYAITGDSGSAPAETLAMLGLGQSDPKLVPWSVLRSLPEGANLSPNSASVVHEQITAEMANNPLTNVKGLK